MLKKLGKYEIKSELSKGSMVVVYLPQETNLGRPAALKVMAATL
jgi:serine/threonine protein kinase